MRCKRILACAVALAVSSFLGIGLAFAQSWSDPPAGAPPQAAASMPEAIDPAAVSGPTVYVVDKYRRLATVNLGTKAVHVIGTTSPTLTDIAFDPKNHELYGITFTALYSVNKANATTKYIGPLGVSDANALVFNSFGTPYSAGVNSGDLYKISVTTGHATHVGSTGGYASAGDLTYYNDALILAGFKGAGSIGTKTPNYLVQLNPETGHYVGTPVLLPIYETFGLVSTGKNELYGFALDGAHPGLYQLFPTEATIAKRAVLLKDLYASGLGQILGAAYDGNYQP